VPVTSLRSAVLVLALIAAALAAPTPSLASESPRRACERASAPFEVGTATIIVRSRGNRLRTTVAYPATGTGAGATPVCRRSPLVIAGHGSQGDGASAAQLHYYLVRRGYVVAAPTFPAGGYDFAGFASDVSRTITTVRRRSRADSGALSGLVRPHRKVGYIGTSMGAIVGLTLCDRGHRDGRIGAIVAKAGAAFGRLRARGAPPVLMINGDADTTIPYDRARATYADLHRPKGLITLAGVGHDLNTGGDPILVTASSLFLDRYLRRHRKALARIVRAARRSEIASLRKRW
jgi:dienelactone hydrolase